MYKDGELILSSINSSSTGNVLVGTYKIYPLHRNQAGQYYCSTSNVLQSRGGATVVANSTVMTLNVYCKYRRSGKFRITIFYVKINMFKNFRAQEVCTKIY